jgi:origin recognition complex subunit 3
METVFKIAVVADDVPIRLGPPLLRGLLDRQRDHLAGVQAFVSSLKVSWAGLA